MNGRGYRVPLKQQRRGGSETLPSCGRSTLCRSRVSTKRLTPACRSAVQDWMEQQLNLVNLRRVVEECAWLARSAAGGTSALEVQRLVGTLARSHSVSTLAGHCACLRSCCNNGLIFRTAMPQVPATHSVRFAN